MPLVLAAQQGDEEARNELLSLLHPIVRERYTTSPKLRVRADDLDDVAHAVLVEVARSLKRSRATTDRRFLGWVWGVARRVARSFRGEWASDVAPDSLPNADPDRARVPWSDLRSAIELLVRAGVTNRLHRRVWTILRLDPSCRRVDLADHLDMSPATVRSIMYRTDEKVRDYLGGQP